MTSDQEAAFLAASGIHADKLTFAIRLLVGGTAILCAVLILIGLMHLLDSNSSWDKMLFIICLLGLSFVMMMIFIYIA